MPSGASGSEGDKLWHRQRATARSNYSLKLFSLWVDWHVAHLAFLKRTGLYPGHRISDRAYTDQLSPWFAGFAFTGGSASLPRDGISVRAEEAYRSMPHPRGFTVWVAALSAGAA
jgi:hypothetical protein